jgi:hypothetical protein
MKFTSSLVMESFSIFRSISSLQILIKSPKIEKYAQIIFFFFKKSPFVGKLTSFLQKF